MLVSLIPHKRRTSALHSLEPAVILLTSATSGSLSRPTSVDAGDQLDKHLAMITQPSALHPGRAVQQNPAVVGMLCTAPSSVVALEVMCVAQPRA
jgi:hypothetical protein